MLIFQPQKPRAVVIGHLFVSLFVTSYIWTFWPFSSHEKNTYEFLNEFTVLVSVYLMTGYTDFFNSDQGRFEKGRMCRSLDGSVTPSYGEQCGLDYIETVKKD